jgi:hypothetical protein
MGLAVELSTWMYFLRLGFLHGKAFGSSSCCLFTLTHSLTSSCISINSKQTDVVFLDREIKSCKQAFGIEIYDLMADLEGNEDLTTEEKESKIRASFDAARKDIAVIAAKKECKMEEMHVLDAEGGASGDLSGIPPSSGTVLSNQHPSEM